MPHNLFLIKLRRWITASLIAAFSLYTYYCHYLAKVVCLLLKAEALIVVVSIVADVFAWNSALLLVTKVEGTGKAWEAVDYARVEAWTALKHAVRAAWLIINLWWLFATLTFWIEIWKMAVNALWIYCKLWKRWNRKAALFDRGFNFSLWWLQHRLLFLWNEPYWLNLSIIFLYHYLFCSLLWHH